MSPAAVQEEKHNVKDSVSNTGNNKKESDEGSFICYGLTLFKSRHPKVKKLKKAGYEPSIHGTKCWSSAFVMMDYFEDCPPEKGLKVLDLGCGWGPLAVYLAKHHDAHVVGVDADPDVFPFLQLQAEENGVEIEFLESRFEKIPKSELDEYDLIIGTDICFWNELVNPLFKLVKKAKKVQCPTIIIADPGRSPFYKLHKKCIKKFGDDCELQEWQTRLPSTNKQKDVSSDILIISSDQ